VLSFDLSLAGGIIFIFSSSSLKSKKKNKQTRGQNEVLNKKWNILNNVWASLYQQAIMNLCCMPVLLVNGNDLYVRTDRNSDSSVLRSTYKVIRSIKEWLLYWIYCSLSIRVFIWLYKQGDHICNMVVDLGHPVLFSVGYSFTCMLQHLSIFAENVSMWATIGLVLVFSFESITQSELCLYLISEHETKSKYNKFRTELCHISCHMFRWD